MPFVISESFHFHGNSVLTADIFQPKTACSSQPSSIFHIKYSSSGSDCPVYLGKHTLPSLKGAGWVGGLQRSFWIHEFRGAAHTHVQRQTQEKIMFAFRAYCMHTRKRRKTWRANLQKTYSHAHAGEKTCCDVWTSTCTQMQTPTHCLQGLNDFTLTFTGMFFFFLCCRCGWSIARSHLAVALSPSVSPDRYPEHIVKTILKKSASKEVRDKYAGHGTTSSSLKTKERLGESCWVTF